MSIYCLNLAQILMEYFILDVIIGIFLSDFFFQISDLLSVYILILNPNHNSGSKKNLLLLLFCFFLCSVSFALLLSLQVNLALKQKSDIEHYRNKLRLKAKKKGYYDFQFTNGSSNGGQALSQQQRNGYEREAGEHGRPLEPDDERGFTYVKSQRR